MLKSTYKKAKRLQKAIAHNRRLLVGFEDALWRLERGYQTVELGSTVADSIAYFQQVIASTKGGLAKAQQDFDAL